MPTTIEYWQPIFSLFIEAAYTNTCFEELGMFLYSIWLLILVWHSRNRKKTVESFFFNHLKQRRATKLKNYFSENCNTHNSYIFKVLALPYLFLKCLILRRKKYNDKLLCSQITITGWVVKCLKKFYCN